MYTNVLLYLTVFPNRFSAPRDQVSVNLMPLQSIYQNLHAYHHGYPNLVFKFGREHFVICATWFFFIKHSEPCACKRQFLLAFSCQQ